MKTLMIILMLAASLFAGDYYQGKANEKALHDAIVARHEKRERRKTIAKYVIGIITTGTAAAFGIRSVGKLRRR